MYKVIYKYDYIEHKKVFKGFEAHKIENEEVIGEYDTLEEAKRHPLTETEKKYPKGVYVILKK